MKKDFIYFLGSQICCDLIIYLPHNILATTMLLYTERQIKYKLYINFFLLFFFGSFFFFLSLSETQHFFINNAKTMMNLILIVQTQSLFSIGNFTTLMRCSVNKNRRQSVKHIVRHYCDS